MADKRLDLIDRQALLIEVTEKYRDITAGSYPFNIVAYDMAQLVKEASGVDAVEVVHGRWIAETERMGHYSHCSECGIRCQGYTPNYKYCPNCGAKMDGDV